MKSSTEIKLKREKLEQSIPMGGWHSRYYRRQFDGWTEIPELGPDGRQHIRRVYTGEYYQAALSDSAWRLRKVWYGLLLAVSAVLYALGAVRGTEVNRMWYGSLPQAIGLFGYIFSVWFYVLRLTAPRKLTRREYREAAKNLRIGAMVVTVVMAVAALCALGHSLLVHGGPEELIECGLFLGAAVCSGGVWLMEQNTRYDWVSNKNASDEGFAIQGD